MVTKWNNTLFFLKNKFLNKIPRLIIKTSYKLYITSLKRYYSSTIYYKECAYGSKVLETLQKNRPVIILESTISHGKVNNVKILFLNGNRKTFYVFRLFI